MSPSKPRKQRPLDPAKEVKRRARLKVGQPPPSKPHKTAKDKAVKHKKQVWEDMFE